MPRLHEMPVEEINEVNCGLVIGRDDIEGNFDVVADPFPSLGEEGQRGVVWGDDGQQECGVLSPDRVTVTLINRACVLSQVIASAFPSALSGSET